MLLPYLSLVTPTREIEDTLHVEFMYSHGSGNPLTPGINSPVITNEADNKIIPMRWGLGIRPGKAGLPWVRSEGIISKTGTRVLIRTHRCLVFINCFFIRVEQSVYLIYLPGEKIFALAGIWEKTVKPDKSIDTAFAIITRDAPQVLKKFTSRIPLIITRPIIRMYLDPKSPLMDITGILNSTRYPPVNGYPLRKDILDSQIWSRRDLLPAGNEIFPHRESREKLLLHNRYYR